MENLYLPANVTAKLLHREQNRGESFLKRIGQRYLQIDGMPVNYWLPNNIKEEFNFVPYFENAIHRNKVIFGEVPSDLEFVIVGSTEEYNHYKRIMQPVSTLKVKGDWEKACSLSGNKILIFHYDSLESETDLKPRSSQGDLNKKKEYYQKLFTHEVAHAEINSIANKGGIPGWVHEGLAYLVAEQANDINKFSVISLRDKLNKLRKVPRGWIGHLTYDYSFQFIRWLFKNYTTKQFPFSQVEIPNKGIYENQRIQLMVNLVRDIGSKQKFNDAFQKVFGVSYEVAYRLFLKELNAVEFKEDK